MKFFEVITLIYDYHPDQHIHFQNPQAQASPSCLLLVITPPGSNQHSHLCPHRLAWPVIEYHINGIIAYFLFCVWFILLNIMSVRLCL